MLWLFVIGITNLNWSFLQNEWSLYMWVVLLSGLLAFLLGSFCIYVLYFPAAQIPHQLNYRQLIQQIDIKRFETSIVILFGLYLIAYIIEYKIVGFLPVFTDEPSTTRLEFNIFGIHLFVNSVLAVIVLITEYLVIVKPGRRKRIFFLVLALILLVSYFFLMNRLYYLLMIISLLVITHYSVKKITIKKVGIFATIFITIFFAVASIRLVQYAENFLFIVSEMNISPNYSFVAGPYMYISMNLENLNVGVNNLGNYNYGLFSFDFLLALIRGQDYLRELVIQNSVFQASRPFTTFPYMWSYYRDFGYGGVTLFSFLWGILFSSTYWRMRTRPTPTNMIMYCLFITVVILSFFTNLISRLNFIFNILLVLSTHLYIKKKANICDDTKNKHTRLIE